MKTILSAIACALVATTVVGTAHAQSPTPTATPTPANLTLGVAPFTATANPGDIIGYDIGVTNSGQSDATGVLLTATLPVQTGWYVNAYTGWTGCSITAGVLQCFGSIPKRTLNAAQTDFVNGYAAVGVIAVAGTCGNYATTPLVIHPSGNRSAQGVIAVACPATPVPPTPTPSPVPATPTPQPTIVPTSTPAPSTPVPTATPVRVVPLPPNTGSGLEPVSGVNTGLRVALGLVASALGFGAIALRRRL